MSDIVIVAAKRTAQGRFLGLGSTIPAVELALAAGRAALAGIDLAAIDQLIIGNVLSAGVGMNIARQISLRLGLPLTVPAFSVNMMCGSGMQAVILAAQAIRSGDAETVLCGGCESMSNAPLLTQRDVKSCALRESDSLLCDGLTDPLSGEHMGVTAERLARAYDISRAEQDAYAERSHRLYGEALAAGRYSAELVQVGALNRDEHYRPGLSVEKLRALTPAFSPEGTVTPGNASGINDGAALLVVASAAAAQRRGWTVLARINAWATVGCEPTVMGLGPVHALRRLRELHRIRSEDCDVIELNEAFAAQALACQRELGLDSQRINVDGGAIALGHPIGATGARLLVHLAQKTAAGACQRSLAALCIGGGMGAAVALEATTGPHR